MTFNTFYADCSNIAVTPNIQHTIGMPSTIVSVGSCSFDKGGATFADPFPFSFDLEMQDLSTLIEYQD